ncbi:MAG: exodeoxyribonuclease V subunit gamma [Candidatus Algichlamydia australiensis]|nr:exodeoxyribonuclease V subunit gamma [Chlamydiales bacterium]
MSAIIASQQLEILVKELSKFLYKGFSRKFVITPSDEMKGSIFAQLATEKGVALGAKFYKPAQGVQAILRLSGNSPHFPTPNALALHLESELPKIPELEELIKTPKQLRDFADHISQLFLRYAKAENVLLHGWQKRLYEKIFSIWDAPANFLPEVEPQDLEVHVFGAIPKLYRDFFAKMPRATFYFLNPTREFWGDLLSDKSRLNRIKFYEKKGVAKEEIAQFTELTSSHHPLLANFGKMGGEIFSYYQDLSLPYIEKFAEPNSTTLLQTVQKDLLEMQKSNYEQDGSIQLHSACSMLREIEVLKTLLLNLFAENPDLQPSDVLVLAPKIADYESHISLSFGSKDLPIPFEIQDLPFSRRSDPAQALLYLFSLQNCAWEREEILRFFHFASVKEHIHFTDEELKTIEKWLEAVHLKWGYDETHRVGTWEEAFRRLLFGLAMEEEPEHLAHPIELSEAELLGKFLQAVRSLREDLRTMETKKFTLREWKEFFHTLCERYLGSMDFQEDFSILGELLPDVTYRFASVERAIRRNLARSGDRVRAQNQNCITFTSLKSGNARPAKVIALLGMEKFPHQETFSSLQQAQNLGPTASEEDRYLFLELLISAREKLLFFYSNLCPQDGREQSVSFLVQELMDYLELDLHTSHPSYPFHPKYFKKEATIKEFSSLNFSKASEEQERQPFFQGVEPEKATTITINQLKKLAKNPLRFYLNETLNIHLPFEYDEEFLLAPWEKNAMQLQSLRGELQIEEVSRAGKLPSGLFEKVAIMRLEKELAPLKKSFDATLFAVELKASCEAPYKLHEKKWIIPALQVGDVTIEGEIENLSEEGLLHIGGSKLYELLPIWPTFLVFQKIAQTLGCKEDLLILKESKRLSVSGNHLETYLSYFEEAKKSPSPFTPRAAENILKGKPPAINTQFIDPHLKWAQARALSQKQNWEGELQKYFSHFAEKEEMVYSPLV